MVRLFPTVHVLTTLVALAALAGIANAQPLAGSYDINNAGGGDYTSIGAAFTDLETVGVSAPVTFNVFDDGGPYASGQTYGLGIDDLGGIAMPITGSGVNNPIVFRAAAGESPVVQGAGFFIPSAGDVVTCYVNSISYITFEGIEFTGGNSACLFFSDFIGAAAYSNVTVRRCRFTNATGGPGFGVAGLFSPAPDVLIENNFIYGNAGAGGPGIAPTQTPASLGLAGYTPTTFVRHNTIVHNNGALGTGAIMMIENPPGLLLGDFSYNIVICNVPNLPIWAIPAGGAAPPQAANYNNYFYTGGAMFHRDGGAFPDLNAWQIVTGLDANSFDTDPILTSLTVGSEDLHLSAASFNVVDQATGSTTPDDIDAHVRPSGPGADIGADERVPNAPEIDVQRPAGTSIPDGGADNLGNLAAGGPTQFTYTIQNSGLLDLDLTGSPLVDIQAQVNCTAVVTAQPATNPIPTSTSTTFTIDVTPTAAGAFNFDIVIPNNDADENPYNIAAQGIGVAPAPEIDIQRPAGTSIADGGVDALGNMAIGVPINLVYTIENTGSAALTLTTPITVTANANCTASATVQPTSPVAIGNTTTFTVQITITAAGAFDFDVSIVNNDADENPYNFNAAGTGVAAPEIDIQRPAGTSIPDGGADALGSVIVAVATDFTYTIENQGTANLTLTGVPLVDLQNLVNCTPSVTANPTNLIAPAGTTTFTVSVTVTAAGAFSFDIVVANDDGNESTYTITASGTGNTTSSGGGGCCGVADAGGSRANLALILLATLFVPLALALRRRR